MGVMKLYFNHSKTKKKKNYEECMCLYRSQYYRTQLFLHEDYILCPFIK